ncbi:MAG: cell division protein FtsA [Candidatus Dadabacteria bacterium]|nr:MAG: cell division protein FtsA [Candidatus Dadabacteria bacterium]
MFNIKDNTICAIDIGTYWISVIIGEEKIRDQKKEISIIGVGKAPSLGVRKGVVINIDQTVKGIKNALYQAEEMAGKRIKEAVVSVNGARIIGINNNGSITVKGEEITEWDLLQVKEIASAVPLENNTFILHQLPQEYIVDGYKGIKEPVGITGSKLEEKTHLVIAPNSVLENIEKCLQKCGIGIKTAVLSAIASAEAVLTNDEKELGTALIDLGAGTTSLIVYYNGSIHYSRVFPIGNALITSDVAAGLRTPLRFAENIKKMWNGKRDKNSLTKEIKVPNASGQGTKEVCAAVLYEIIDLRLEELISVAIEGLKSVAPLETLAGGVVLTGGGALMKNIDCFFQEKIGCSVRIGSPNGFLGLTELINSPDYAAAAGLLKASQKNKLFANISPHKKIYKKVVGWLSTHF